MAFSSSSVGSSSKSSTSSRRNHHLLSNSIDSSISNTAICRRDRRSNVNANTNINSRNRRLVDDCNDHNPIMRLPSRQDTRRRINENHSTSNHNNNDDRKDICCSSSSLSSPSDNIVRESAPFIHNCKTVQVLNNSNHNRRRDNNSSSNTSTDIETNNDFMLSKAILFTSSDNKSSFYNNCNYNIVRRTDPYTSKSNLKKGKDDHLYGLQKLHNISESTSITESIRSLSGSLSSRGGIERGEEGESIVSSSTEVPEPPPLRNLNNVRNISQPGAFQINPTTSPISLPAVSNTNRNTDAHYEIDDFEEYYNVMQQHSISSPSQRRISGSYPPYYNSNNNNNNDTQDIQCLIEATLVEDICDDDTMVSSFKGISALVTALDNEGDRFMDEPFSSERSGISSGGNGSERSRMHTTVDLVEAEPLKNRGSCWFSCVILLTFIALGTGGTLGLNYDTMLAPRIGNFTMWTRAPKTKVLSTIFPTILLTKTLMLRVNDDNDRSSSILVPIPSILKDESNKPSLVPIKEKMAPTDAPTTKLDHLLYHILPEYTKDAIINGDNDSPQYKAYKWLENDQLVSSDDANMSIHRSMQRFVLAVLYYSTNGDKGYWRTQYGWMRHTTHECDWYTDETTGMICSDDYENYETLHLNNMNLTGTIPSELFLLSSLVKVDLSMNALTGEIPTQIENCHNLRHLDLFSNHLRGPIIPFSTNDDTTVKLKQLAYLDLDGNLFRGRIPKELSKLTNLRIASFMNNQLSGSIPTELFAMWGGRKRNQESNSRKESSSSSISYHKRSIDFFDLAGNMLTGVIPTEIGLLEFESTTATIDVGNGITMLDMSNNHLVGIIPTELGLLTDLKRLYLQNNQFHGNIPSELGNLKSLEVLWLEGTNIWGIIPNEVCELFHNGKLQDLSVNCLFVQCFYCECTCRF